MKDWNEKSLDEIIDYMEDEKIYYKSELKRLNNGLKDREKKVNICGVEYREWEELILGCEERIRYIKDTLVKFYRIIKDNNNKSLGEELDNKVSVSNKVEYTNTLTGNDFEISYKIV